jgi:hypothetical protein
MSWLLLFGCKNEGPFPENKQITEFEKTDFVATLENPIDKTKNIVYSASLLFAWDQIKQELGSPIVVNEDLTDLFLLNNSNSYKKVLNKLEYVSSVKITDSRITAKAQFAKSLPFLEKLNSYKNKLTFDSTKVSSFGANGHYDFLYSIIEILYYQNDSNFIVRLNPKDKEHQILLLMTSKECNTLGAYYAELNTLIEKGKVVQRDYKSSWRCSFMTEDQLIVPKFSFNISKNYNCMEQKPFETNKTTFWVEEIWQRTAFILDESGAEIESEATAVASLLESEALPIPKKLIFNKPFCLFLARTKATNPYFAMWVANAELMLSE